MSWRSLMVLLMAAALSWQVAADQPPQWPQQALDKVDVALGQYQRQAAAQQLSGVVISVHDGDSLRVRDAHGRVQRIPRSASPGNTAPIRPPADWLPGH